MYLYRRVVVVPREQQCLCDSIVVVWINMINTQDGDMTGLTFRHIHT